MIIRVEKNRDNPYVIMNKTPLEDSGLTWKAKGLLSYLLSKPDNWKPIREELAKASIDGIRAVRSALKELEEAGYMKRHPMRKDGKIVAWEHVIYEVPQYNQVTKKPLVQNVPVENVPVENSTLISNDLINTDPIINEPTTSEREILNILKSVKNYPFDYDTDLAHIRALTVDFPNSNIQTEAKKWATYKLDKPLAKKSNPRLQLRNWLEKSIEFEQGGKNAKHCKPTTTTTGSRSEQDYRSGKYGGFFKN